MQFGDNYIAEQTKTILSIRFRFHIAVYTRLDNRLFFSNKYCCGILIISNYPSKIYILKHTFLPNLHSTSNNFSLFITNVDFFSISPYLCNHACKFTIHISLLTRKLKKKLRNLCWLACDSNLFRLLSVLRSILIFFPFFWSEKKTRKENIKIFTNLLWATRKRFIASAKQKSSEKAIITKKSKNCCIKTNIYMTI